MVRFQPRHLGVAMNILISVLALYVHGRSDLFAVVSRKPFMVLFLAPLPMSLVLFSLHFFRAGKAWSNIRIRALFLGSLLFLPCLAMAAGVLVP